MSSEEVVFAGFETGDPSKGTKAVVSVFVRFSGKEVELAFDLGQPIGSQDELYARFDPLFQSFARAVAKGASAPPRPR